MLPQSSLWSERFGLWTTFVVVDVRLGTCLKSLDRSLLSAHGHEVAACCIGLGGSSAKLPLDNARGEDGTLTLYVRPVKCHRSSLLSGLFYVDLS
jgi:hypothetical protein